METILIAEDNFDLRVLFSMVFEKSGYVVRVAMDGQQALDALETALPDLLILDINMPNVSGLDVLTFIRQHQKMCHLKVIIVTGNALAEQSPEAGLADLFLIKPVSLPELVTLAKRLIAGPESDTYTNGIVP